MTELFEQNVKDAYFDFNKADIRTDARDALTRTAEFLRSYPQVRVTIEDIATTVARRNTNIGLGERRAQAAKNYLISLGITADRMDTVSWARNGPSARSRRSVLAGKSPRALCFGPLASAHEFRCTKKHAGLTP